jgi:hypothetical protein
MSGCSHDGRDLDATLSGRGFGRPRELRGETLGRATCFLTGPLQRLRVGRWGTGCYRSGRIVILVVWCWIGDLWRRRGQ